MSYARKDDNLDPNYTDPEKSFTRRLYNDLKKCGLDVWWDQVDMSSRGQSFTQEIGNAISHCDLLLLVLGPNALTSSYVQQEYQHALKLCIPVLPILREGDYETIPAQVKGPDARDFVGASLREDNLGDYKHEFDRLVRQINTPLIQLGPLNAVPSLTAGYIERINYLSKLVKMVCPDKELLTVVTPRQQTTVLQGIGGIGKTTLANSLCYHCDIRRTFSDGIFWFEIGRSVTRADVVNDLRIMGELFGDSAENYVDELQAKVQYQRLLADKAVLIVLDDVWNHRYVEPFQMAGSHCRIVVTTRQQAVVSKLGVQNQFVDILTEKEGVHLFHAYLDPNKLLKHKREIDKIVKQIIKLLGGHPLAIRLAAGLMWGHDSDYTPRLLERLKEGRTFEDLRMDEENKDLNLELSLSISYEDLPKDRLLRARFRALGAFSTAGDYDKVALKAVWDEPDESQVEDDAADLVRRGLLENVKGGRFRQHNLLHDYAAALASQTDELEILRRRHFDYYRQVHGDFRQNYNSARHLLLDADYTNVRDTLNWGFEHYPSQACDLAWALSGFLLLKGRYPEQRDIMNKGITAAQQSGYHEGEVKCIQSLGDYCLYLDQYDDAQSHYEKGLAISSDVGYRFGEAICTIGLGDVQRLKDHHPEARSLHEKALVLSAEVGYRWGQAYSTWNIGTTYLNTDEYAAARPYYEQARTIFQEIGDKQGVAWCDDSLGSVHFYQSEYPQARVWYQQARETCRDLGDQLSEADIMQGLGEVHLALDEYDQALAIYGEALTIHRKLDIKSGIARCVRVLGDIRLKHGEYTQARERYEEGLSISLAIEDKMGEAYCTLGLARAHLGLDEYSQAQDQFENAQAMFREIEDVLGQTKCICGLADVRAKVGENAQALALYEEALAIFRKINNKFKSANCILSMSNVHLQLTDYKQARSLYSQALDMFREMGTPLGQVNTLAGFARLASREGQTSQAGTSYRDALAVAEQAKLTDHPAIRELRKEFEDCLKTGECQ